MKAFSKLKGYLLGALTCVFAMSLTVSGALFARGEAKSVNAEPVSVSADIQKIIDGLNVANNTSAEYVTGEPVINSAGATVGTVAGVKLKFLWSGDRTMRTNLVFDTTALRYDDSMLGLVFTKPCGDMYVGFTDPATTKTQLFDIGGSGSDSVSSPQSSLSHRTVNLSTTFSGSGWTSVEAMYYSGLGYKGKSYIVRPVSPKANTTVPFNFYYDNATNVLYGDINAGLEGNGNKLLKMMNVNPNQYANFENPFEGEPAYVNSSASTNAKCEGFTNNKVNLSFRLVASTGSNTMVLTSVAGLDLTNPQNAFTADNAVLSTEETSYVEYGYTAYQNDEGSIPAAAYVNPVTGAKIADFNGTINVYSGTRSSKAAEYGSYGYAKALPTDDGLVLVSGNVDRTTYAFTTVGDYTVEYKSGDDVRYIDVTVTEPQATATLSTDLLHVDLAVNGIPATDGAELSEGQVLTFTPSTGYTYLFGYDNRNSYSDKKAYINGVLTPLVDTAGVWGYTLTEADIINGSVTVKAAAYQNYYNLSIGRDDSGSNNASTYVYEGIPGSDYINNSNYSYTFNGWSGGAFYSIFKYDGQKTWINSYPWSAPADSAIACFKCTMSGKTFLIKNGTADDNKLTVTGDTTIIPVYAKTFIDTNGAFITEDGTPGLAVRMGMLKSHYDNLKSLTENNDREGASTDWEVNAVVTTGDVLDAAANGRKDAFHVWSDHQKDGKVIQQSVSDTFVEETVNGAQYMVFYAQIYNIPSAHFVDDYVFGAYINIKTVNGGWVLRFAQLNATDNYNEFVKVNMYGISTTEFTNKVSTEFSETANKVTLYGVDYYSSEIAEVDNLTMLVKYYYKGMFVKNVKTEATEGYTAIALDNGDTYYYDASVVSSEDDALKAISVYKGITAVKAVAEA